MEKLDHKLTMDGFCQKIQAEGKYSPTSSTSTYWCAVIYKGFKDGIPKDFMSTYLMDNGISVETSKKLVQSCEDFYQTKLEELTEKKAVQKKEKSREYDKIPVLMKAATYLGNLYNFKFNRCNKELWCSKKEEDNFILTVEDSSEFYSIYMELKYTGINISYKDFVYLLHSDFSKPYYPFREFLESCPKWDSIMPSELDRIIDSIQTTDEGMIKRMFLTTWFLAMVKMNICGDGINQYMLVFSGEQGIGKSSFIHNILPPEARRYKFSGSIDPENKDTSMQMSDSFIIEWDELTNMNKRAIEAIKSILTQKTIRIRRPFQATLTTAHRVASFIGSTNEERFLVDMTGNRRFLCLRTTGFEKIDINYKILYGELLYKLETGEKWYFSKEDGTEDIIEKQNASFMVESLDQELLLSYFSKCSIHQKNEPDALSYRITDVIEQINILGGHKLPNDNFSVKRMGVILRKNGFETINKQNTTFYLMKPNDVFVKSENPDIVFSNTQL